MFPVKYDVFVSYSREDMERVRPLAEELRRRGYRVFFDLESMVVGERFKERLERSIRSSRTLVLCWSADAQASQFVHYEYMRAIGLKKHVFPWLLDETPLPQMVELHGITSPDAGQAAAALQKRLGWSTARRRWIAAAASALAMAVLALVAWHGYFAQPPWRFEGEVITGTRACRSPASRWTWISTTRFTPTIAGITCCRLLSRSRNTSMSGSAKKATKATK